MLTINVRQLNGVGRARDTCGAARIQHRSEAKRAADACAVKCCGEILKSAEAAGMEHFFADCPLLTSFEFDWEAGQLSRVFHQHA